MEIVHLYRSAYSKSSIIQVSSLLGGFNAFPSDSDNAHFFT